MNRRDFLKSALSAAVVAVVPGFLQAKPKQLYKFGESTTEIQGVYGEFQKGDIIQVTHSDRSNGMYVIKDISGPSFTVEQWNQRAPEQTVKKVRHDYWNHGKRW